MTDQLSLPDLSFERTLVNTPFGHGALGISMGQYEEHLIFAQFRATVVALDYRHEANRLIPVNHNEGWTVAKLSRIFAADVQIERSMTQDPFHIYLIVSGTDFISLIQKDRSRCEITVFALTPARAEEICDTVNAALRFEVSEEDEEVSFLVWGNSEYEMRRIARRPWKEVAQHYPEQTTRQSVTRLMDLTAETKRGGQVIIWHGEPGTGKTSAIVALATEWNWCQIELISDPETLMRNHSYLSSVIQGRRHSHKIKARLLVFEDADGLVVDNGARGSRSSEMARLLGLADGLLGYEQKIMKLFTTNAAPDHLDPALSRPGRCLAHTKFDRFEPNEIRALWPNLTPTRSMTLAEIWSENTDQVNIFDASHAAHTGTYL